MAALQALDIPVEGQRGVGGGYRVRPGYRLPPLMLNDDEAVAIVLGLIGARGPAVDGESEPVDGALGEDPARASRRRCAPRSRRWSRRSGSRRGRRARRPPSAAAALLLADAIRRRRRVRCAYRSLLGRAHAARAEPVRPGRARRALVPGRLRPRARRPAHVPRRSHDERRHRRAGGASPLRRTSTRSRTSASRWPACPGSGRSRCCSTSRSTGRPSVCPPTLAELAQSDDQTLLRMRVNSLDWMAGRARRSRLRLRGGRAGRAPRERAGARRPPRGLRC